MCFMQHHHHRQHRKPVQVEPLTAASIAPFGSCVDMLAIEHQQERPRIGQQPIVFVRDPVQQVIGSPGGLGDVSYSVCVVDPRPLVVDVLEYHSHTGEGILGLDGDMILQLAPATRSVDNVPVDQLRAFLVKRGTLVVIRPGVWHHAPFCIEAQRLHVLIALPERTYENDCTVVQLGETEQVRIEHELPSGKSSPAQQKMAH
jgi:ureidoglycolate lyase